MPKQGDAKTRRPAAAAAPAATPDPRFARVGTDPRFARFPKAKDKVEVDDRFKAMLTDPAFRTGASVDKRGGQGKGKKAAKGGARAAPEPRPGADAGASADDAAAAGRWARARGLAGPESSSSSEGPSSSGSDSGDAAPPGALSDIDSGPDDATLAREYGVGALAANPDERVPVADAATPRLALVDLDWERTRAVDILAVLRSFAPAVGRVERATVYPSDYGLARMADEDARGPAPLRAAAAAAAAERAAGRNVGGAGGGSDGPSPSSSSSDGGEPDAARLRAYERSRLRYYYAIVECDSAATAERVAAECDGSEFLRTGATIDCRFVAAGDDFSARTVRDTATLVPADYAPPDEVPLATQFTKPTTGWDADDGGRRRALARAAAKAASADALRDDDFRAYLGSDDSSSGGEGGEEGDGAAAAARYRALLAGSAPDTARSGGKDWAVGGAPPKTGGDLSVTFAGGLDALSARLAAKKDAAANKASRTVWDNYLAARADKRAARKAAAAGASSDDDADGAGVPAAPPRATGADDPFDDPFFADDGADVGAAAAAGDSDEGTGGAAARKAARKEKKAKSAATAADAADTARLELLAMDDAALRAGAVAKAERGEASAAAAQPATKPTRKARARARAAAKAAGRVDSDDDGETGFAADLGDARFSGLLTDPAFALDPTDPASKRGGDLAARVTAAKKRRKEEEGAGREEREAPAPAPAPAAGTAAALVASLKRKAAAAGGQTGARRTAAED